MLNTLNITNYKSFKNQNIGFAQPKDNKLGSGLTVIIGENNSGKTNFLEYIASVMQDEKHNLYKNTIEICKADRKWNPNNYSGYGFYDLESIDRVNINNLRAADNFTRTSQILAEISEKEEVKQEFNSLVRRIIPNFGDWHYNEEKIQYVVNNIKLDIRRAGSGLLSVMRICLHLLQQRNNSILIIDEPENYLSPISQKQLVSLLAERSKSKQIIVLTHSVYFIKWEFFDSGTKFIRFNNVLNNTEVKYLDNSSEYVRIILSGLENYQKPQLFDITAREIMISNKLLIVEGQEDMGIVSKWLRHHSKLTDVTIFGYGAGGIANIQYLLEMAHDLGIEKVGGLFDFSCDGLFQKAVNQYTNFCIQELPTEDIRDKFACDKHKDGKNLSKTCGCKLKNSIGVFYSDGIIKEESIINFV